MTNKVYIKTFLMILFIPLLMGNENCQMGDMVENILDQVILKTHNENNPIYISHLTMIDGKNNFSFFNTESAQLINSAVLKGIHLAQKKYKFIKHNVPGHTLRNTEENTIKLKKISMDRALTKHQKMDRIINELMKPAKIDIIVTGIYFDNQKTIEVRPFIVNRKHRKIVTKQTIFDKERFLCPDPNNPGKKNLCQDAIDEIAVIVKELLSNI